MTYDTSSVPARKKRSVLRWIAALILSLLLLFLFQLLGPDPPLIVSRPTTFITEPLRPNGLPDYEQYVLELNRNGVTAQDNAAALLWQALRDDAADPAETQAVRAELGLPPEAATYRTLVSAYHDKVEKRIFAWLRGQNAEFYKEHYPDFLDQDAVDELVEHCMSRPWTRRDCPVLAEFVHENRAQLDLIVSASKRPRFYWPTRSLLNNTHDALICDYPYYFWDMHNVTNLSLRAMLRLSEGRSDEAWSDLLALYRLARLTAQGNSLYERFVAFHIEEAAHVATISLLHHGRLTTDQLKRMRRDLVALPPHPDLAECVDKFERVQTLDVILHMAVGNIEEVRDALELGENFTYASLVYVNWNSVLTETNAWYDRLAAALEISEYASRSSAVEAVYTDLWQQDEGLDGVQGLMTVLVSRRHRTRLATVLAWNSFVGTADEAVAREGQITMHLELARLTAALAVFRATHQHYPDELGELSPGILKQLPVDLYGANPFVYRRDGDGFLLYSKGLNGEDDGGSHRERWILEGWPYDEGDIDERMPMDADDIAIRVPYPAFEVPRPPF